MTTYTNCAPSDPLTQHDTYRLTVIPGAHLLEFLEPDAVKTAELGAGMSGLFAAGGIGNVIPLFSNPYVQGDLAEVIDVLVMSDGSSVGAMVAALIDAANDSSEAADIDIDTCQRVVGANAAVPGTDAADLAVYSPAATAARSSAAATASTQQQSGASNNWVSQLESELGVAGKYVVYGVGALALFALYRAGRRAGVI